MGYNGGMMEIDEVLNRIICAKKDNFNSTAHFNIKLERRKNKLPNYDKFVDMLESIKPIGIIKQNNEKFKIYYELDEKYDMVVILSIKSIKPLSINLITIFPEKRSKREREW